MAKIYIAPKSRMQDVLRLWKLQHIREERERAVDRLTKQLGASRRLLAEAKAEIAELEPGLEAYVRG